MRSRASTRISPAQQPAQQALEAVDVHRLFEAIAHRLPHQRMIGNDDVADEVLAARDLVGEHGGEQVFGVHARELRRHFLAAAEARQRQRDRAFQRQRVVNIGAASSAWIRMSRAVFGCR